MNDNNDDKIISLGHATQDNRFIDPEQTLKECLEYFKDPDDVWHKANKLMVVVLNTNDGKYSTGYRLSNLSGSEVVALCDVMKTIMLKEMGYT